MLVRKLKNKLLITINIVNRAIKNNYHGSLILTSCVFLNWRFLLQRLYAGQRYFLFFAVFSFPCLRCW